MSKLKNIIKTLHIAHDKLSEAIEDGNDLHFAGVHTCLCFNALWEVDTQQLRPMLKYLISWMKDPAVSLDNMKLKAQVRTLCVALYGEDYHAVIQG